MEDRRPDSARCGKIREASDRAVRKKIRCKDHQETRRQNNESGGKADCGAGCQSGSQAGRRKGWEARENAGKDGL